MKSNLWTVGAIAGLVMAVAALAILPNVVFAQLDVRQEDRQTDRQMDRREDRQLDRRTDRQSNQPGDHGGHGR